MSGYYSQQQQDESAKELKRILIYLGLAFLLIIAIVVGVAMFSYDQEYNLVQLQVKEGVLVEADSSEGYWLRVAVPDLATTQDLWIEVSEEFYQNHRLQTNVGVLVGLYDKYDQKRQDGKILKRFRGKTWGVEEIYNSLAEAQVANPIKQYTVQGQVQEKLQRGKTHVLKIEVNQQAAQVVVEESVYKSIQIGKEVPVKFESIGEFSRITGIENRRDSTT